MVDWLIFLGGAAVGGVAAFATGAVQELGAVAARRATKRFGPPEDVRLPATYVPKAFAPGDCAWVRELKAEERASDGWTHYVVGPRKAKAYRLDSSTDSARKEFLMVKPGAVPTTSG